MARSRNAGKWWRSGWVRAAALAASAALLLGLIGWWNYRNYGLFRIFPPTDAEVAGLRLQHRNPDLEIEPWDASHLYIGQPGTRKQAVVPATLVAEAGPIRFTDCPNPVESGLPQWLPLHRETRRIYCLSLDLGPAGAWTAISFQNPRNVLALVAFYDQYFDRAGISTNYGASNDAATMFVSHPIEQESLAGIYFEGSNPSNGFIAWRSLAMTWKPAPKPAANAQ